MTSPAQRHMMRVSAAMTAQREAAPLRHATVYEQMLVKLAADQRTLKAIYSKELKAAKKRELLPFWLPWVNGVLEQGKGAQDDILMAHLQRATQLDCQAGVKKEIERLERELKPKPEPQPKAATRAPRKTRSATPAKRGRPKKKAS
ncbi:phage terminase small subunit [Escherichia coli]|uniref:phage terminase small subunit n=1 Tax=Escherichia coli TaxID=562 RepID=UPI00039127B6|nr:phage terminase small subunit [Escherichia coli]EQU65684.1 hypothetical protein G861_03020 [Escherichia coli HVH 209 (4-3062651)]